MNIPKGHQAIMPYLILEGAKEFMDFAKEVFGAQETYLHLNPDQTVMHAEININGSTIMIGDAGGPWKPRPASLYIYAEDVDHHYKKALEHGATTILEPEDKSYGRSCGVEDAFGNVWWITAVQKTVPEVNV